MGVEQHATALADRLEQEAGKYAFDRRRNHG